jgi:hypothetical protein
VNDWSVENRFRLARTSGRFVGPYPAEVNTAATLAQSIGGAGATLRYASGPLVGQPVADPSSLNGNGLAIRTHLFNASFDNLDNYANDLKLSKTLRSRDAGTTRLTLGYFKSCQYIVQDWHWNTYLQDVRGKNSALLDVVDAAGNVVTQNGMVAYGEPFWGNCCVRFYDLRYDTDAPYLSANWERDPLNIDSSLRYYISRASGTYTGATGTTVLDVNGDGVIQQPARSVPIVNNGAASPVDYRHSYLSYSLGANYLLNSNLAVFARVSEGGRANAERLLFGGGIRPDGSIAKEVAINKVKQLEGGVKWRSERFSFSLFATAFHATTAETNQNITSVPGRFTRRKFAASGLELEGSYRRGPYSLIGGLTYTHGKIYRAGISDAPSARRPRRRTTRSTSLPPTRCGKGCGSRSTATTSSTLSE